MAGWNTTGCTVVVEKGKSKACISTWKTSTKSLGVVSVSIPFEAYTKTPTMRRVDPSGQYAVEIVEVSTVTDGTETNPYSA